VPSPLDHQAGSVPAGRQERPTGASVAPPRVLSAGAGRSTDRSGVPPGRTRRAARLP